MKKREHKLLMKNIKYCGNCNPDVHPKYIRPFVDEMFHGIDSDTVVLINGCVRGCLTKSKKIKSAKKIISVNAGEIVGKDKNRDR
jgi:hypothetical protein